MSRFLVEFWPALLPLAIYLLWLFFLRREKTRQRLTSGPLFWSIVASFLLIVLCFLFWSQHQKGTRRGHYVPTQYGPGTVQPGRVTPSEVP
ncbi:MAG: hypothetical protein K2Q12_09665 [Rickettsiales bacterium]|nr:hypothetical protein [Rickettsiales bacterium]